MAIPHAEKLIQRAQGGERLNTKDRRHALAFLIATQAAMTNSELGTLFQVSERQIRFDTKYIREEKARLLSEDDIKLVVADIAMTLERQMHDLEKSKLKCKVGTPAFLQHCKAIHEIQLKTVEALQNLGYYPKNLGSMVVEKFEYQAIVTRDGSVANRPVDMQIGDGHVQEAEFEVVNQKQLPEAATNS